MQHRLISTTVVLFSSLLLLACFNPSIPDSGVQCSATQACPETQRCEPFTATCVPVAWPAIHGLHFEAVAASYEALGPSVTVQVSLRSADNDVVRASGGQFQLRFDDPVPDEVQLQPTTAAAIEGIVSFPVTFRSPYAAVRFQAVATNGVVTTSPRFDITPTTPAIASLASPAGDQGGCVAMAYSLVQAQGLPVDLAVELDPDGPGPEPYRRATQAPSPGAAGVQGVPGARLGKAERFVWDSSADLPGLSTSARLKFTPSLGGVTGKAVVSEPIPVSNGLTFVDASGTDRQPWVGIADVDGDGAPDEISDSTASARITFGQARFQIGGVNEAVVPLPAAPLDAVPGDFDHDGRGDLAVATAGAGVIIATQSRVAPRTFGSAAVPGAPIRARQIIRADIDRNGRDDLITVDDASGAVKVLVQTSTGAFSSRAVWPGSADTARVAFGDVNGDGLADLVVGRRGAPVTVLAARNDGSFAAPFELEGINAPIVGMADLDGDGTDDVVALTEQSLTVVTFDGPALAPTAHPLFGSGGVALALADVDGDGLIDLVTASQNGVVLRLHRSDRTSVDFAEPRTLATTPDAERIFVADLGVDRRPHILASLPDRGIDLANVTPPRCVPSHLSPRGVSLGPVLRGIVDATGDGKLDLVVEGETPGTLGSLGAGLGDGTFTPRGRLVGDDGNAIGALVFADLDGNGHLDSVMGHPDDPGLTVHLDMGESVATRELGGHARTVAVIATDVDRDGAIDLVELGDANLQVRRGDRAHPGNWLGAQLAEGNITAAPAPCGAETPCALFSDDLDRDGKPEIIAQAGDRVQVYREDPTLVGRLVPVSSLEHEAQRVLAIGDVLGDESPEVLVEDAGESGFELIVYELSVTGSLEPLWTTHLPFLGNHASIGDLDGDGRDEIVLSLAGGNTEIFSPRDYPGGSGKVPRGHSIKTSGTVAIADVDADGRMDVVVCSLQGCMVAAGPSLSAIVGVGDGLAAARDGRAAKDVRIGDLDADGLADLGWVDDIPGEPIHLARQQSEGTARFDIIATGPTAERLLAIADMDGDRRADLLTSDGSTESLFVSIAAGEFGEPQTCPTGQPPLIAATADVDKDGTTDVVRWDAQDARLERARAAGCTNERPLVSFASDGPPVYGTLVDLDNDGWLDVVTVDDAVYISLQNPDAPGTFEVAVRYPLSNGLGGAHVRDAQVVDVDGDRLVDVLVASELGVSILRGDALNPGALQPLADEIAGADVEKIRVGDIDGDSRPDLVIASAASGTRVHLGGASGDFDLVATYSTLAIDETGDFEPPSDLQLADLDGDGLLDMVLAGANGLTLVRGR